MKKKLWLSMALMLALMLCVAGSAMAATPWNGSDTLQPDTEYTLDGSAVTVDGSFTLEGTATLNISYEQTLTIPNGSSLELSSETAYLINGASSILKREAP